MEVFHREHPGAFHPVTHQVIARGSAYSAIDAYRAMQRLQELRRRAEEQWLMDFMVLPTAGRIPRIAEAEADLVGASVKLGRYTNFVNLLDLSALALLAEYGRMVCRLGLHLLCRHLENRTCWRWDSVCAAASWRVAGASVPSETLSSDAVPFNIEANSPLSRSFICVVGAHLSGQPLNYQLTELDGVLVKAAKPRRNIISMHCPIRFHRSLDWPRSGRRGSRD